MAAPTSFSVERVEARLIIMSFTMLPVACLDRPSRLHGFRCLEMQLLASQRYDDGLMVAENNQIEINDFS